MPEREDADTSTSFLEPTFDIKIQDFGSIAAEQEMRTPPNIVDPVFVYSEVRIPRKIEKVFRCVSEIKFIYSIVEDDCIEVLDLRKNTSLLRVFTSEFSNFDFTKPPTTSLSFIFNREEYKAKVKSDLNKKYKKSLEDSAKFVGYNHFTFLKEKYLSYQLEHGCNFVFVNNSSCLHAQIRSAVSLLGKKERYIPKVRKSVAKDEYMREFLMSVSGISEGIALAILTEHATFESIERALRDKESFCGLKVLDPAGANHRTLPERVYKKLFNIFLSENPEERI